jgi:hypothetical protein
MRIHSLKPCFVSRCRTDRSAGRRPVTARGLAIDAAFTFEVIEMYGEAEFDTPIRL